MEFREFLFEVVQETKQRYKLEKVCIDDTKRFWENNDFEGAVENCYNQTIYWNGDY
jgi:hypothetical protein